MLKWLKRIIYTILFVFFLTVGVFFSIRNPQLMALDFVFWKGPELSVALYILISFAFGVCVSLLMGSVNYLRSDRQIKILTRRYEKARNDAESLRKASITKELAVGKE
ncbi:LapA family protein [Marinomonas sp.]|nr:LapA family protein [Marinomonas sp.]MDB4837719.1 LapA family protein [Marinomonas sp.]